MKGPEVGRMSSLVPSSRMGKWSIAFILASLAFAVAGSEISTSIANGLEYPDPVTSPLLGTVIYLMFAAAIAASALGLLAMLRRHDHSPLLYLSTVPGVMAAVMVIVFAVANLLHSAP